MDSETKKKRKEGRNSHQGPAAARVLADDNICFRAAAAAELVRASGVRSQLGLTQSNVSAEVVRTLVRTHSPMTLIEPGPKPEMTADLGRE